MTKLSKRLVRIALFASAASLLSSYAVSTLAQIPVFQPEPAASPEPEPAPEPGVSSPAAAAPSAPAAPEAVPPAAAAPPAAPAAPGLLSSRTPPAKTDVITEPQRAPDEDEDDDETGDERLGPQRKWYGWQTLTADGASFAMLVVAARLNSGGENRSGAQALAWFGLLGYELTPGMIHFVHKNPGRGFASMGLRLGMPLAGAFLGASVASGCSGFACQEGGAGVGILLGMGAAIAIDAAVLAYDDPKKPNPHGLALTPLVSVTPRQAWLGIGGQL